ncbi:MAG TPA: hypothetical protein PKZ84_16200 [Anaerolineae bacterium]|nr:hypothetical protein [Anaerolineae bacterium]HQI86170.1 hypothetical protein [Anaerolineae bacterium]
MSKKHKISRSSVLPLIVLTLLILTVTTFLSGCDTLAPTDIANPTEDSAAARNPKARPTATPEATFSEPDAMPWAGADGDFDYYVLALSWQPAFCETQPGKEECATQTASRFDATNFALHGLWPTVIGDDDNTFSYCDVTQGVIRQDRAGDWCEMPELALSDAVWQDLTLSMPGTASCLHNHEWYKHGVCTGMSPDTYYALTNALVERFAATEFNRYVAGHVGDDLSRRDLLNRFDAEFGDGASDYLSLRCTKLDGVSLLSEIQIVLRPDIAAVDDFTALFPDERIPPQGNCPQTFTVDRVGLKNY